MTGHLFVYGTLRAGREPPGLASLLAGRRRRAPARVPGRLHDLGAYPGAILDPEAGEVVGELVEVAPADLAILDRYEDHDPAAPATSLFRRVRTRARLPDGPRDCWIYVYNRDPKGAPVVAGGAWRRR